MTVDLTAIHTSIADLGRHMSSCTGCSTASGPKKGTPPRCLWFEGSEQVSTGVIVVGLNPGRADEPEREFYRKHGMGFDATVEYLQLNAGSIRYYLKMRNFVAAAFGQPGGVPSIHWTELAKCELLPGLTRVPLDMKRTCVNRHLKKELDLLPRDWPIVATGREAFESMAILAGDRAVIGVPHPTGAFGSMFSQLIDGAKLARGAARLTKEALRDQSAVWLPNQPG